MLISGRIAFEKLTDFDYRGNTYYTVKNLTLYECQGWCREEAECQAAAFSFVLNPLIPVQVRNRFKIKNACKTMFFNLINSHKLTSKMPSPMA